MSLQERIDRGLDFAAFIARYAERDARWELHDGEAYAMAGGSPEHGALALNAAIALRSIFRARGCGMCSCASGRGRRPMRGSCLIRS